MDWVRVRFVIDDTWEATLWVAAGPAGVANLKLHFRPVITKCWGHCLFYGWKLEQFTEWSHQLYMYPLLQHSTTITDAVSCQTCRFWLWAPLNRTSLIRLIVLSSNGGKERTSSTQSNVYFFIKEWRFSEKGINWWHAKRCFSMVQRTCLHWWFQPPILLVLDLSNLPGPQQAWTPWSVWRRLSDRASSCQAVCIDRVKGH